MTELTLPRPGLLVSVRSAAEAEAALRGGADIIDVKEPSRGSLGRADDETIADVVRAVGGQVPVSAAMGELTPNPRLCQVPGVSFAKWGLAGWDNHRHVVYPTLERLIPPNEGGCRNVAVAYADWKRSGSPRVEELLMLGKQWGMAALVIDTYIKDGSTLLDWTTEVDLVGYSMWRDFGIQIALAGSLGVAEITVLRRVRPTWFAVRGAACNGGRDSAIDEHRVRELKQHIASLDRHVTTSHFPGEPGA